MTSKADSYLTLPFLLQIVYYFYANTSGTGEFLIPRNCEHQRQTVSYMWLKFLELNCDIDADI